MNMFAVFGFLLSLFNVVEYFYNIPRWYKLGFSIFISVLTFVPAAISLGWAIRDLCSHPFSKVKFITFGLAKYFLGDAFQDVIDYVDRIERISNISGRDDVTTIQRQTNRFSTLFRYILYSDPLTRAYKRQYYSYAHLLRCTNVDLNGGKGHMHDATGHMHDGGIRLIEGAYDNAISIRGHRLCVVHMSKTSSAELFKHEWQHAKKPGTEFNYCLVLDAGSFQKHKILSDEATKIVDTMMSWWSANPEKPILMEFDRPTMIAKCASLYVLYCAIDDGVLEEIKHEVIDVGDYVQIG